ncbi:MAG: DUF2235 domain-containing protein [Pseudohongiellaceae bacterium]
MPSQRNIIICCDGTGNEYGSNKTNVVRVCEIAATDDSQIVFYDPGVGTGGWEYDELSGKLKDMSEQATGGGLQKNVEDAYRFLMQVYEPGDNIYLFGFSRGAFTVRSLAGMLFRCGLLRPDLHNLLEQASKIYNRRGDNLDAAFKDTFSRSCPVHFIGVWDTVESLVLHEGRKFHDTRLNKEVSNAYHAIALDEVRKDFPPCLWDEDNISKGQIMEQVWFAGVHSDVGGWYDERGLSDITLRWMLGNARRCGMKLKQREFAKVRGNALEQQHDSHTGFWNFRGKHKRQVPPQGKIHESVRERMENTSYKPVRELPADVEYVG